MGLVEFKHGTSRARTIVNILFLCYDYRSITKNTRSNSNYGGRTRRTMEEEGRLLLLLSLLLWNFMSINRLRIHFTGRRDVRSSFISFDDLSLTRLSRLGGDVRTTRRLSFGGLHNNYCTMARLRFMPGRELTVRGHDHGHGPCPSGKWSLARRGAEAGHAAAEQKRAELVSTNKHFPL